MLQPMRISIGGYQIKDVSVYIFVQTHIQKGDLSPIEYINAEKRAEEMVKMFSEDLKIETEKIKVCKNLSKPEILSLIDTLVNEAKQFKQDHKNDSHSVKSIFFSWVGFCLSNQYHPYMKRFDIDRRQFPCEFQLTVSGEPINMSQHMLRLILNTNTNVFLFQDYQA